MFIKRRIRHMRGLKSFRPASATLDGIEVVAIAGGNVNYAFCIKLGNGSTIFLKQAPEFVAIFGPDGFPLTSERMQREMDVYSEWKAMLGEDLSQKYLPTIHFFDSEYERSMPKWTDLFWEN